MKRLYSGGVFVIALLGTFVGTSITAAPQRQRESESGTDWPQWRGPRRDNVSTETGLLKQWPKEGPPLVWKAKGIGAGYSSVAVAGGRIYTMGDGDDSSYVHALDLEG